MLYTVFNYSTDSDKTFLVSERCSSKWHLLLQVLFFFCIAIEDILFIIDYHRFGLRIASPLYCFLSWVV